MYLFIFSPKQTVIIPRRGGGGGGELGLEDLRGSHGFQGERRERSVVANRV